MRQGLVFLLAIAENQLQMDGINILLLLLLIAGLIVALVLCKRLSKKYHLYDKKKDQEILKHT